MKLRPKNFKKEIIQLHSEGFSSNQIVDILKGKHSNLKMAPRSVRNIIKNHGQERIPHDIDKFLNEKGVDSETPWSTLWYKPDKEISVLLRNPNANKTSGGVDLNKVREDFIKDISKHSPKFKKIAYEAVSDPHCLVIDIADLHIGKLATETGTGTPYNVETAIERAKEGVRGLLAKSSGFNIGQIVFVIGNDVLHIDNTSRGTTKGTPQDTDGMWYDNFVIARTLYTSIITGLSSIAPVHVIHCPSNHDFMSGFMLADSVQGWLYNNPNVTFDVSIRYRKFYRYGKSLMMFEHGDGSPVDKLPMIMAEEAKKDWAETDYRYIYLHHIHSNKRGKYKVSQDFPGVNVQYLRSPSGTDMWHDKSGWVHSVKAIEAFLHSEDFGQSSILTHYFK